jgi:hypothetical protein
MGKTEEEKVAYISITDQRARKLKGFVTDGDLPSIAWATRMGLALGILENKREGKKFGGRGHGIDVDSVDPEGFFRIFAGNEIAKYARGGLDILIRKMDQGKDIFDIYREYAKKR